jgi:GT2 family glycosyltransferase
VTRVGGETPAAMQATVSVVIPTFRRERVLIDTLRLVVPCLRPGDEVLLVDQTLTHEPGTESALGDLAADGTVRWYRRGKPHICEAMNLGGLLARGDVLLFLDDDVVPSPGLVEAHRAGLATPDPPPATCGQVLQPWDEVPVSQVRDFAEGFNAAYDQPCDILSLMAGNFAIRRDTYLLVGGMDENFFGPCYRLEAELSYRIFRRTGRKVRFLPEASLRHLQAGGGTRSFGDKDTWGHIGGSVGDYYFALRSLPPFRALGHCLRRLVRAPLNRATLRRPWLVPSLFVRECVAWVWAAAQVALRPGKYVRTLAAYDPSPVPGCAVSEPVPAPGEVTG